MSNSKDSVTNLLLIKRAKRRLVGAIIILIILFSLSIFFVKTKTEAMKSNPKISFLETTQQYAASENVISKLKVHSPVKEELTIEHNSSKKKGFTVQLGIFSDEINMKRVKDQVNSMGYKTNTQAIKIDDEVKIRLTTEFFSNEKQARLILQEIKKANLSGFIRKHP